ncbi:MAG: sensor histidine kinase KdpD [Cellulomonas sp.]|nr:sensor histidine kinase KdpD [Cellulomonas sp.]
MNSTGHRGATEHGVPETAATRSGRLTVYFGAAPGVGKTYAMLDEAHRRQDRGTDVVVGFVETHGRAGTAAQLDGLEVVPRRTITYQDREFTELDIDEVLRRAPRVAMIDELAHTNVPGSRHEKRWQDVEELLEAGIDVVTTVNVQHLESLNDDVHAITGVRQRETVPDRVVRDADQIQLIDLPPQALRRRLAHGNVYRAEQIDASLSAYFRVGNLTALRELALLWLADRVDDALTTYRRDERIETPWPARERIVVAVTGGPEGETLLRRGARIAQRASGSELIAVHVLATDGLPSAPPAAIAAQRALVESLGGVFDTVIGEDVASAVVDFARAVNATMIVVGVSRRSRLREALSESYGVEVARLAQNIDVHLMTHEGARSGRRSGARAAPLSGWRTGAGWVLGLGGTALLTAVLYLLRETLGLPTDIVLFLALTVAVALVGGRWPSLVSAVVGFLALNFFFTPPTGRLTIADPENALALAVFLFVAIAVASVVDLAGRRTAQAFRARAEASALAAVSRSVLSGQDTAQAIVDRLGETFTLTSVSLLERSGGDRGPWTALATSGEHPAMDPEAAQTVVSIDEHRVLALCGRVLPASDRRVLEAFASQAGVVLEQRKLRAQADEARALQQTEATRNTLLAAVSHDLRTPLAMIRTAVDGLASTDVELAPEDSEFLVSTISTGASRLERLIDNLLDLSRVQTGSVRPMLQSVSLDEIVPLATEGFDIDSLAVDVPESLPLVRTDPGMLERVLANVISNAVRHSPSGTPVRVSASPVGGEVVVRIADTGHGLADDAKGHMFEPFQRLGDSSPDGLGLGLAVAQGLAIAVGATLTAEDTPGGGLTIVLAVPVAEDHVS